MREILFKAKRIDNGEWVEGYYVKGSTRHCILKSLGGYPRWDIEPKTLSQYTGFKDKNGNKIFENDILRNEECKWFEIGYVQERKGSWEVWAGADYDDEDFLGNWCSIRSKIDKGSYIPAEVIGNTFDNPELVWEV